jgi:hypothetical protein
MTNTQLQTLKTELQTDPRGYGYNHTLRNDSDMVSRINTVRDGTNPPSNPTAAGGTANGQIQIKQTSISRQALINAIDTRDLKASPTVLEGSILESVLQSDTITLLNDDGTNNLTRQNLNRLLNDTNGSQTRLGQIAKRNASRAEELFGSGVAVTTDDVASALN